MGARGGDTVAGALAGHAARTPDAPFLVTAAGTTRYAEPAARVARTAGAPPRVPDEVIFVDHLPRTSMGKIQKHLLRRQDATQGEDDTHDP